MYWVLPDHAAKDLQLIKNQIRLSRLGLFLEGHIRNWPPQGTTDYLAVFQICYFLFLIIKKKSYTKLLKKKKKHPFFKDTT